jgi:hypothetical protein
MKLNVPFYKQTTPLNCGPVVLKCVLSYFGKDFDLTTLEEKIQLQKLKGISSIQIATVAGSLGFKTDFYSKEILFNKENLKLDFYKKYNSLDLENSKIWLEKAKKYGVHIEEKTFPLNELLNSFTKKSIPIVLIDWNKIVGRKGYQGHFVPIVGYDNENVYIHNVGLIGAKESMAIPKQIFDKARKAKGTDEDLIIISNL